MLTKNKRSNRKFSVDDFVDKLILVEKTERGIRRSINGEVISEDELDIEIEKWFK